MAVVYVFAHFDDEYCALPLVLEGVRAGQSQYFLYLADYRDPALGRRRHDETRALLTHLGVDPARAIHVGAGTGALDGGLHLRLEAAYAALAARVAAIGPVEKFVVVAWEGGHQDHDMCAVLASELAAEMGGTPVEQFSLYNGPGLIGPLFRGASPLPQNGPVRRVPLTWRQLLFWLGAVRFFPSQTKTWLGLWPAMFCSYARRGFGVQRLEPARVRERPHKGVLLYERMFGVKAAEVLAAVDAFLARRLRSGPDPA